MSIFNKVKAGFRTASAFTSFYSGWRRDVAMIYHREDQLARAVELGRAPEGTLEYALEIIELNIRGRIVAKTRWEWAQWKNSQSPLRSYPYRSYDSDKTKGVNTHLALLDLVSLNKANPELSIDELNEMIAKKYWH